MSAVKRLLFVAMALRGCNLSGEVMDINEQEGLALIVDDICLELKEAGNAEQ
jgi:hypothetical protein